MWVAFEGGDEPTCVYNTSSVVTTAEGVGEGSEGGEEFRSLSAFQSLCRTPLGLSGVCRPQSWVQGFSSNLSIGSLCIASATLAQCAWACTVASGGVWVFTQIYGTLFIQVFSLGFS